MKERTNEPHTWQSVISALRKVQTKLRVLSSEKEMPSSFPLVFSEAALISNYINACLLLLVLREVLICWWRSEGSAMKCPLQSRVISVQKNTEVANGGRIKATVMSILEMPPHG